MYMLSAASVNHTGTYFGQYVYRAELDFNRQNQKDEGGIYFGQVLIYELLR